MTIAIAIGVSLFAALFMFGFYKLAMYYLPDTRTDTGSRARLHKDIPELKHETEDNFYSEAK